MAPVSTRCCGSCGYAVAHITIESTTISNMTKVSKSQADYREGFDHHVCAYCAMFNKHTHSCTAVQGKIAPYAVCDYYRVKV